MKVGVEYNRGFHF